MASRTAASCAQTWLLETPAGRYGADFDDLLRELFHAASLEDAARDAGFTEGAFVAVREVAGVRHDPGARANPAKPAVGLSARRAGAAKVGEDDVGPKLVRELSAEHRVRGLADDAEAGDEGEAPGK